MHFFPLKNSSIQNKLVFSLYFFPFCDGVEARPRRPRSLSIRARRGEKREEDGGNDARRRGLNEWGRWGRGEISSLPNEKGWGKIVGIFPDTHCVFALFAQREAAPSAKEKRQSICDAFPRRSNVVVMYRIGESAESEIDGRR